MNNNSHIFAGSRTSFSTQDGLNIIEDVINDSLNCEEHSEIYITDNIFSNNPLTKSPNESIEQTFEKNDDQEERELSINECPLLPDSKQNRYNIDIKESNKTPKLDGCFKSQSIENDEDEQLKIPICDENHKEEDYAILKNDNQDEDQYLQNENGFRSISEISNVSPQQESNLCTEKFKLSIGENSITIDEQLSKKELLDLIHRMKNSEHNVREKYETQLNEVKHSVISCKEEINALSSQLIETKTLIDEKDRALARTKECMTQENIYIRTELTNRLEQLMNQCQTSNKDKESMVVKYAHSESEVLKLKKQRDGMDKKIKDLSKDKELLQGKLKLLTMEKSKISNVLENKIQELNTASREVEKMKDELNARDIKIKWGQTKLRTELDTHKETQSRLDKALDKITRHQDELHTMKKEAEKIVQDSIENEDSRANLLDHQLKEHKALLITERQKKEDLAAYLKSTTSELETLKNVYFTLENDSSILRDKVVKYEQEREESEKLLSSLQAEVISARQGEANLSNKLSTSSAVAKLLEKEQVKSKELECKVINLESTLGEQSIELSQCRKKEAELLSFTQKLTDQNVKLQSQLTSHVGEIHLLQIEKEEAVVKSEEYQIQTDSLQEKLNSLINIKDKENERLKNELDVKSKEVEHLKIKVSDLFNEIKVQQRKHQNANKDINRELVKSRKRLAMLESERASLQGEESTQERREECFDFPPSEHSAQNSFHSESSSTSITPTNNSLSPDSRSVSNASLNAIDSQSVNGRLYKGNILNEESLSSEILVERILRLQKEGIKRSEKIDFLEEHVTQLVSELKKKNKIIHHYIMKEETGVISNSKSDSSKAEIIKKGGIMASVYGSAPKDEAMTLELSLEINKKLQAVLEDTLLKNITLKDNLNTLGDEVANLSMQNSRLGINRKS